MYVKVTASRSPLLYDRRALQHRCFPPDALGDFWSSAPITSRFSTTSSRIGLLSLPRMPSNFLFFKSTELTGCSRSLCFHSMVEFVRNQQPSLPAQSRKFLCAVCCRLGIDLRHVAPESLTHFDLRITSMLLDICWQFRSGCVSSHFR